jgi:hypothetical protein
LQKIFECQHEKRLASTLSKQHDLNGLN